jgi:hypothetical protein
LGVFARDRAPDDDEHVLGTVLFQAVEDARHERHVRARQDGDADRIGVFLDRGLHDLVGRLVEAGVNHFHAGVTQRARDDLRAAVVPVEPGLRDHDSDLPRHAESLEPARSRRFRLRQVRAVELVAARAVRRHEQEDDARDPERERSAAEDQKTGVSRHVPHTSRSASHISPIVA